jgi:chromosome segregation ATPase
MGITNKELYEKLDAVHERINDLVEKVGGLAKDYATTKEQVKTLKISMVKNESNIEGHDGTISTIEKELDNVCTKIDGHLKVDQNTMEKNWNLHMWRLGGAMSLGTGIAIGIILLIARLFLGV